MNDRRMAINNEREWMKKYVIYPFFLVGIAIFVILVTAAIGPTWVSENAIWGMVALFIVYIVINIIGGAKMYL